MDESQVKVSWEGEVVSVQVRSTVWRYLIDNRTHRECGYNVFVKGAARACGAGTDALVPPSRGGQAYDFCVAISEKQQGKVGLHVGDRAKGTAWTPLHPKLEFADFYRAGALKVTGRVGSEAITPTVRTDGEPCYDGTPIPRVTSSEYPGPPWTFAAPPLEVYSWRGARMLGKACWKGRCFRCVWAAMADVTIQYDFDRGLTRHRAESFCYGPLSCGRYKMGPARSVPYKGRGSAEDVGWLDEICVQWREDDDE